MQWRFTIIDRNGLKTIIEEPNGWADFSAKLKRHPQRHGTFREIQANSFQFLDNGAWLIKAEYEAYGAKGNMQLLIELATSKGWWEFHRGVLLFPTYKFACDGYCYAQIDVDQLGPIVDLINRFEQSVDITKNKSFDGTTTLTDYPFLNFNMTLPSKAIFTRAEAVTINNPSVNYNFLLDTNNSATIPNVESNGFIVPKFDQVDVQEIDDFRPSYQFDFIEITGAKPLAQQIENYFILEVKPESALVNTNTYNISMRLKGSIITQHAISGGTASVAFNLKIACKYGPAKTDLFAPVTIENIVEFSVASPTIHNTPFDFTFTGTVVLARGEKVWPIYILEATNTSSTGASPWESMVIAQTTDSYFKINSELTADPTSSKVFMINETVSRVIESITDNRLKLFSSYFGRSNSAPYSFPTNGCGSQRILTNGLYIRNVRLADSTYPCVFMSMKDIFEALAASDNIGMGPEGDNAIRMENWKWFYKTNVIHRCDHVAKIERSAVENEIYSTFKCGYEKWEFEDYNGLDEFMTKREFRLDIPQVKNTMEQICKFIASGYACEVTRRKGNTSTDWRYDNNIFMICVEPDGGSFKVELNNVTSPANMIDPPTIYNFRITPTRNALKWFDRIIGSYRNVNSGHKIIFASADGNYVAEGELNGSFCKLEAGLIKENQDLSITLFADQAGALPIMWPERVKFSYPLGSNEYRNIQQNPYGLIEFTSVRDNGSGWIDEITYKPNEGIADFTLIPKIK